MFALAVSIVLGVTGSNLIRYAQARDRKMVWVGAISYSVGALLAAGSCFGLRHAPAGWREMAYGSVGGLAWVGCYLLFNLGVRLAGLSITQCVTWLAVTVPVVAGRVAWQETPTRLQTCGLALVLLALFLLLPEQPQGAPVRSRWRMAVLAGAFLAEGINSLAMKAYTKQVPGGEDSGFLMYMFAVAAAGMLLTAALTQGRPVCGDWRHGSALGLVGVAANVAFIAAIRQLPAAVMFTSFWAGSVVLTAVTAMVLWRERYSLRAGAGMVVAVVAMILLHLRGH